METLLQNAGKHGLSIRQLKKLSGLSKNNVKRILFNSKNVRNQKLTK
jgi:predicted transcriptional regulator